MLKIKDFSCFKLSDVLYIMSVLNVKMPTIVRISTFMGMRNVNLGAGLWLDLLISIDTVMNAADNNLHDKFLQDNL